MKVAVVMTELCSKLSEWVVRYQILHNALNSHFTVLSKYHSDVPKYARTLLKTPREYVIKDICGGSYHHFGVEKSLVKVLSSAESINNLKDCEFIALQDK